MPKKKEKSVCEIVRRIFFDSTRGRSEEKVGEDGMRKWETKTDVRVCPRDNFIVRAKSSWQDE